MDVYEEVNSGQDLLTDEENRTNDVLTVVSCAQRLIDTNDRVLSSLTEGRKEQEDLREALEAVKAKQDDIVTALSNIQQICSTSSTPYRSPEGRNKYVNREVLECLVRVGIVFSI